MFKTKILFIILAFVIASCNPFISKDLRQKNRCNRKLERVTKKCPQLLVQDTIIVKIDTTIIINEVKKDSSFAAGVGDTIYIDKEKLSIKFIRLKADSFFIEGKCKGDTIYIDKIIRVPYQKINLIELTFWEKTMNFLGSIWKYGVYLFIFLIIFYILYKLFRKYIV